MIHSKVINQLLEHEYTESQLVLVLGNAHHLPMISCQDRLPEIAHSGPGSEDDVIDPVNQLRSCVHMCTLQ